MNDSIGNPKFAKLSTLALCLFVLPHGNSDPERGFSMNKHFLKVHGTSLKEDTITALRLIKDDVILLYNGVTNIDISMEFITCGQSARTSYKAYLEAQKLENELNEKRKAEVEANKKKEEETKGKLDQVREAWVDLKMLKANIKVAEEVVTEGNTELGEILKKKPFNEKKLKFCRTKIDMGLKWKSELESEVAVVEKKIKKIQDSIKEKK